MKGQINNYMHDEALMRESKGQYVNSMCMIVPSSIVAHAHLLHPV